MTQHKKTPASLFPANMLVQHQGERVYTTSLKVAEHFGKRHDHVIRDIRALLAELPEEEHLPNFGEMTQPFTAGNGAVSHRTVYTMSHDGFALLAMGFTGREALRWKVAFLAAFRQMEKDLHEAQARYAAALDLIAPALRPVAEDARAGLPRAVTAARLGKSVGSITWHRSRARRLQLLAPVSERLPLSDGQRRKAVETIEAQAAADAHAAYEAARAATAAALAATEAAARSADAARAARQSLGEGA